MKDVVCKRIKTIKFWDSYAKWFKLWIEHNDYHDRIIKILMTMVKPGWKVMDIGAGNGVLSLPLSAIGCDVIAIEPSTGMRSLLYEEAAKRGIDWINVNEKRWEDINCQHFRGFDLLIACNSLHLTQMGFENALLKMFKLQPANVFVVTELGFQEIKLKWHYENYKMLFAKSYEIESSFAYHSMEEVFEHWRFKKNRPLHPSERLDIRSRLTFKDDHFWMDEKAYMGAYWWRRTNKIF